MDHTQPPYDPGPYGSQPAYPPPGYSAFYPQYGESVIPHSGLGIASFIIALVGAAIFVCAMVFIVFHMAQMGGVVNEQAPEAVLSGLSMCGGLVLNIVGVVLGIAGLFQPNRKRLFAIMGLAFNGVIVLGVVALMLIGFLLQ